MENGFHVGFAKYALSTFWGDSGDYMKRDYEPRIVRFFALKRKSWKKLILISS